LTAGRWFDAGVLQLLGRPEPALRQLRCAVPTVPAEPAQRALFFRTCHLAALRLRRRPRTMSADSHWDPPTFPEVEWAALTRCTYVVIVGRYLLTLQQVPKLAHMAQAVLAVSRAFVPIEWQLPAQLTTRCAAAAAAALGRTTKRPRRARVAV
jgi:hypothetical protein